MESPIICSWNSVRKALAVTSLIIGSVGASFPETYAKIAFGIALGLSNAAIFLKGDAERKAEQQTANS